MHVDGGSGLNPASVSLQFSFFLGEAALPDPHQAKQSVRSQILTLLELLELHLDPPRFKNRTYQLLLNMYRNALTSCFENIIVILHTIK